MNYIYTYRAFFGSILFGVLLWVFSYTFTPVEPVELFRSETLYFIVCCYFSLIFGFITIKFRANKSLMSLQHRQKRFRYFLIFIVSCFILRWFDLFYIREVSFFNTMIENRMLSKLNGGKSNVIFIIASIFKSLYFLPIIFVLRNRGVSKIYFVVSFIILLFPIVEGTAFGSRRAIFEVFFVLMTSIILYRKLKFNAKNILILISGVFMLMTVSYNILLKREGEKKNVKDVYYKIINARYNELLRPKAKVAEIIVDSTTPIFKKNYLMISLQTGQYISHGVFEFNHIIDKSDLSIAKGSYTFYPFFKLLNRLGIKHGSHELNASPRNHTYLTSFGGFYIDFRWFALILYFVFGIFQRYVYVNSHNSNIYSSLFIYILIINIFLPIMNYIRGSGVYPIVAIFFIMLYEFFSNQINEKSSST